MHVKVLLVFIPDVLWSLRRSRNGIMAWSQLLIGDDTNEVVKVLVDAVAYTSKWIVETPLTLKIAIF